METKLRVEELQIMHATLLKMKDTFIANAQKTIEFYNKLIEQVAVEFNEIVNPTPKPAQDDTQVESEPVIEPVQEVTVEPAK